MDGATLLRTSLGDKMGRNNRGYGRARDFQFTNPFVQAQEQVPTEPPTSMSSDDLFNLKKYAQGSGFEAEPAPPEFAGEILSPSPEEIAASQPAPQPEYAAPVEQLAPTGNPKADAIMAQLARQQTEASKYQKEGIVSLQDRLKKLDETPETRFGGLKQAIVNAADMWGGGGGSFGKMYEAQNPNMTPAQKQNAKAALEETIRKARGDLSDGEIAMLKAQLNYEVGKEKVSKSGGDAGKNIIKSKESDAIQANINFNDALTKYESLVQKHGMQPAGKAASEIQSAYSDLLTQYNKGAGLGALAGKDIELLMDAVKPAGGIMASIHGTYSGGAPAVLGSVQRIRQAARDRAQTSLDSLKYAYGDHQLLDMYANKIDKFGAGAPEAAAPSGKKPWEKNR